jgi:predicted PurR-regulated permease PerM
MARSSTTERLRLTPASAVRAVAMLGATLVVLRVLAASTRVIGWMLAAAVVAALLHPIVDHLARKVPRAVAVVAVVLTVLGSAGAVGYSVVDTIVRETGNVQESAPDAARRLERSDRWGELATDFKLAQRTRSFVDQIPERLRGGEPADAVRAAATRGVAFLATGVLTLFFVLHGPRLAAGALDQIRDQERRERVQTVATNAYRRAIRYVLSTVMLAVAAGLFGYLVASLADVRGAAAFGLWIGLWDVVPLVGALVGAMPVVVLVAVFFSAERALAVAVAFLAWQAFEYLAVQRRIERSSVHLGPFVTLFAGIVGLELYGIGGALLAVVAAAALVAVGDEALPA